jgi:hypothetical protein
MKDIKAAPVIPAGTYVLRIGKYQFGEAKSENKTPFVNWDFAVVQPCQDVELPPEGLDFSKKKLFKKFYITDDAVIRHKRFLMAAGGEEEGENSMLEDMRLVMGNEIIASVAIDANQQGEEFNTVDGFIHIDELETVNG